MKRRVGGRGCRGFGVSPFCVPQSCLASLCPLPPRPPLAPRVADYVVLNKIDMLGVSGGAAAGAADDAAATLASLSAIVASLNPLAQVRCGDVVAVWCVV